MKSCSFLNKPVKYLFGGANLWAKSAFASNTHKIHTFNWDIFLSNSTSRVGGGDMSWHFSRGVAI